MPYRRVRKRANFTCHHKCARHVIASRGASELEMVVSENAESFQTDEISILPKRSNHSHFVSIHACTPKLSFNYSTCSTAMETKHPTIK